LLSALLQRFELLDVIVRLSATALPRDFAALAPLVIDYAADGDAVAVELMRRAAGHVDHLANHLIGLGAQRLALVGGLAPSVEGWLAPGTRAHLVTPLDDAVGGALRMANAAAQSLAA
jgi:glucosamine kinase